MTLHDEIQEQPEVARRLLASAVATTQAIAAELAGRDIDMVLIAARGSSDHAAIYAQYLFGVFHRLPVALAAPAVTSVYGVAPRMERALVIGISQSGRSPDVVGVVAAAQAQGAATIAITNDVASDLAVAAGHVLHLDAAPERAVAATKSYTASLLAVAALVAAIDPDRSVPLGGTGVERWSALQAIPDAIAAALATEPAVADAARQRRDLDRCIVLGRGFEYATAREWALKLKELAQVAADPYSAADFQHGPLALVEPGYPVFAVAPRGAPAAAMRELLVRLRNEHGVYLLIISDDADTLALGAAGLAIPVGVAEWLTPIVSIIPGQLFAYHLPLARGRDVERPRWLSKVTLTR